MKSADEVQKICGVSNLSAIYRYKRLQMLLLRNKFYTDKNEIVLYKQFKKFIKHFKNNEKNK